MLVSHTHRLIYLKTRKTAGTSVEVYLEHACTGRIDVAPPRLSQREEIETDALIVGRRAADVAGARWWNHMPAALVRAQLVDCWDDYLRVSCIRNPFDKVVSAFWMQQPAQTRAALIDGPFAQARLAFSDWLLGGGDLMTDREVLTIDGVFCLTDTIRYECLREDLERLCAKIGLPWRPEMLAAYKSTHRGRREAFADYYDDATAARVGEAFSFEIAQFGYPASPG